MNPAEDYLCQKDEVMASLISNFGACLLFERKASPFLTLVRSIISQQLSAKAADTIERRVLALVESLTPSGFLNVPIDVLRGAGLSASKARYILELSARAADGRLSFSGLAEMPNENVISTLTEISGVGRWTAEMFLIFGLLRLDVLALGDAGLRRAVRLLYGGNAELAETSEKWRPYRSVASWYLWKYLDG